jgi:hypothetical protein
VHLAGNDLEGLSIEAELVVLNFERVLRALGGEEWESTKDEGGE